MTSAPRLHELMNKGIRAHHQMRAALALFERPCAELSEEELADVIKHADQSIHIEALVLASSDARDIHILPAMLDKAMKTVRERYESHADFREDLSANGMTETELREALERELIVDAVMEKVAAGAEPVRDEDVRLWYDAHPERFTRPEQRSIRHILITINADLPDNTEARAWERIVGIRAQLTGSLNQFGTLAMRHSECPSALENGLLGRIAPGMLYEALDRAAFAMQPGEISDILRSEMGFHILFCEAIHPAETASFAEARDAIRQAMIKKNRTTAQRQWMRSLLTREGDGVTSTHYEIATH